MKKPGYLGNHAKSSAAFISLLIHAVLIILSLTFVAVRVIVKDDQIFEAKQVNRPRMKLKKLIVPVDMRKKKVSKPRLRQNIVVKKPVKSLDIKLPELTGVKGGTGYLDGEGGLGIGFTLGDINLFGGTKGTGNELEGTFFDLKLKPDGSPAKMDENIYRDEMRKFCQSWRISRMSEKYFMAPEKRFATVFMVPRMTADEAPKAYNVEDVVKPKQWMAYYHGVFAAPETGRYRFWGIADDVLMVRVKKRLVIDANWPSMGLSTWASDDPQDKKYLMSGQNVRVGDWFYMTKGKSTPIEVLIGERPGGYFFCHLLIEQDGVDYPSGKDGRPLLPIFKTREIPEELISKMRIEPGTCSIEGPTFGAHKKKFPLKSGIM